MKIGIFLKGENLPERFNEIAQKIIKENDETILKLQLASDYGFIETNCNTYHMVRTSNNARGNRFNKVYYDTNTTIEEFENIIFPMIRPLDNNYDTFELIYEERQQII